MPHLKVVSIRPHKKANHRSFWKSQGFRSGNAVGCIVYLFDNELINFETKTPT